MTAETQAIDEIAFGRLLESPALTGRFNLQLPGGEIELRVQRRESPVLVITFAGAINRTKRTLPQFGGATLGTYVPASVIGIADPSLRQGPEITAAWYAGHEGFETQELLPELIRGFIKACGAERLIFVGGSVGGYAALFYSRYFPGSIAIVSNPQTNIERYSQSHQDNYRKYCRPTLPIEAPLSSVIVSNVVRQYGSGFENTVILLQNAADPFHVRGHFAPFLAAIDLPHHARILARLGYWGQSGHVAMPTNEWLTWLRAAIAAPSASAEDIQAARQEYAPPPKDVADRAAARRRAEDIRLAAVIAAEARAEIESESGNGSQP